MRIPRQRPRPPYIPTAAPYEPPRRRESSPTMALGWALIIAGIVALLCSGVVVLVFLAPGPAGPGPAYEAPATGGPSW